MDGMETMRIAFVTALFICAYPIDAPNPNRRDEEATNPDGSRIRAQDIITGYCYRVNRQDKDGLNRESLGFRIRVSKIVSEILR